MKGGDDVRRIELSAILCVFWAASGCASGLAGSAAVSNAMRESGRMAAAKPVLPISALSAEDSEPGNADDAEPASADTSGGDAAVGSNEYSHVDSASYSADSNDDYVVAEDDEPIELLESPTILESPATDVASQFATGGQEVIVTPAPSPKSSFKPGPGEVDQDRFTRRVAEVPLDIRPTEGVMPESVAGPELTENANPGYLGANAGEPMAVCSWTPWTICYRPLYFEDIALERYGCSFGIVQPGVSFVRFLATVPALPYKMTVHRPRSCVCSNGFSRCGDVPPPGYGVRKIRLDAALIEAAVVTGIVFILP